jgi:hypothetical protein
MGSLGAALFAYAGYGIKPSDNSRAGERCLTGFSVFAPRSAGGRPFGDGANFVDEAKRSLEVAKPEDVSDPRSFPSQRPVRRLADGAFRLVVAHRRKPAMAGSASFGNEILYHDSTS